MLGHKQHRPSPPSRFTLYTPACSTVPSAVSKLRRPASPSAQAHRLDYDRAAATVGLSADYVPDRQLRLQLYRRLAELASEEEITQPSEELQDRFGPLPRWRRASSTSEAQTLGARCAYPARLRWKWTDRPPSTWLRILRPQDHRTAARYPGSCTCGATRDLACRALGGERLAREP